MTNQHPITPPFELMNQWYKKACKDPYNGGKFIMAPVLKELTTAAAQWGADQELDACCEWFQEFYETESWVTHDLKHFRDARRPKPLSEADQALAALREAEASGHLYVNGRSDVIRRALERLKELEGPAND